MGPITDQGVIPEFKIPDVQMPLPSRSGMDEEDGSPVRTMVRSVGRGPLNANRCVLVAGGPLPVRPIGVGV